MVGGRRRTSANSTVILGEHRKEHLVNESNRRTLFLVLFVVALMHTGAHISQSFVNYPNWHLIDARSFPAYHWGITIRAGIFLAAPRLVEIVIGLIVLRFRPNVIDRWVVLLGLGLALGALLSTVLISRPIHRQLDIQSNTPELLSRLMATDWIRSLLEFSRTVLYVWVQSRLINIRRAFSEGDV
jgi:hypothetical protein